MAVVSLIAALALAGCRADTASTVSLDSLIISPPPAVSEQHDVSLKIVKGMTGLVPHGDELMIMEFGDSSTEAEILAENKAIGERSLHRYLQANPMETQRRLLRVPDLEDESGSRFFYFEGGKMIAVCAGAWLKDPDYPPVCFLYHRVGGRTVSYELEEPYLVRNHAAVRHRVLRSLGFGV